MSGIMSMVLGARTAIAAAVDEFFNRVTLLLPGDGTNGAQNNTFLDSSSNGFSITRNPTSGPNAPTQGTFSPFSQTGWSGYFNGATTSGPLVYASYSTTNFDWFTSGQDFTLECWVFPVDLATFSYSDGGNTVPRMTGNNDQNGTSNYWTFGPISDGRVRFHYFNGAVVQVTSTATVTANTWNHIAFTKTSSGITIFVNGTATTATAISGTPQSSATYPLTIGRGNSGSINGYVSNYRILKNVTPPYSGTYTVPTVPLTDISGTKILTMQANRFVDSSSVANAMTVTGSTVSIQAFSPFAPTAAYSAATNGGSGYFDGTGDYLSVARNSVLLPAANTDFTIEAWVYPTATPNTTQGAIIVGFGEYGLDSDWDLDINSNLQLAMYINSSPATSFRNTTKSLNLNAWNHVAASRSGTGTNNLKVFVNGVGQSFTTNQTTVGTGTRNMSIGADQDGTEAVFTGYMSGIRLVNGQGIYTSDFTPPTAPPTTTSGGVTASNTALLLNFTNAGITDATAKNDLETVGNFQISTAQSKFGGSSMFASTGTSYALVSPSQNLEFGSGDFTIEFWWYPVSTTRQALYHGSFGTDWSIGIDFSSTGTQKIGIWASTTGSTWNLINSDSGGNGIGTTTITQNAWNHIAFVRNGTTWMLFVNGNRDLNLTAISGSIVSRSTASKGIGVWYQSTGAPAPQTGYIDDFRVTKGLARYTGNFTPPTAAFALQ